MARGPVISVKTVLDNSGMAKGADEAGGIMAGISGKVALGVAGIGVAAAGAATAVLTASIAFESEMGQVFTLLPGISGDAMDAMGDQVLDFSKQMGILPEDVVPALYDALSAGVPQDNVFEFMEVAGKAAIGGNLEVADAVDLLSTAVNAYASTGLEAADASDIFFTTVRLGKTTVPELQASFSSIGPIAAALGVGLDEVGASIAVLTASGTPTSVAANQMKAALAELGKTGSKAATAFEDMNEGMSFTELIEGGGDLEDVMGIIADSGVPVIEMFGSIEGAQGVLGLIANEGEAFSSALGEMGTASGATTAAFDTMDATSGRSMDRIKANFEAVKIELGNKLLPAFAKVTGWVVEHMPAMQEAVSKATEKIGEVIDKYWPIVRDVITAVVEEISELIEEYWPRIREIIVEVMDTVSAYIERWTAIYQAIWEKWGDRITEVATRIFTLIKERIGIMLDIVMNIFRTFKALFQGDWSEMWEGIKGVLQGFLDLIVNSFELAWELVKTAFDVAWALIKTAVVEAVTALPGIILGLADLLFDAGKDLFVDFVSGITEALAALPGVLRDLVMGPIQKIIDLATSALNLIPGVDIGGDEAKVAASLAKAPSIAFSLHSGGRVTQAMADSQSLGLERDEVLTVLQVNETVTARGGGGSGGVHIENMTVSSDRSIDDELRLLLALKGVAA